VLIISGTVQKLQQCKYAGEGYIGVHRPDSVAHLRVTFWFNFWASFTGPWMPLGGLSLPDIPWIPRYAFGKFLDQAFQTSSIVKSWVHQWLVAFLYKE